MHTFLRLRNGLSAALLAANGFTSTPTGIEGRRGFAHVLGDEPDLAATVDGLGTRFEILDRVAALRAMVKLVPQAHIGEDEAKVRVKLADRPVLSHHVEHVLGSLARPMADAAIGNRGQTTVFGRNRGLSPVFPVFGWARVYGSRARGVKHP
jgi:hypothetical protein